MHQNSPMMLVDAHLSSPLDSNQAKIAPNIGGRAPQTRVSWKKGFLTNDTPSDASIQTTPTYASCML